MKFETINGTLCRMVESELLTPEANFPCVVRLIQDDSPMGRNNDFYATSHLLAHIEIINGLDAIHFVRWQGIKTYYSRFEIIGYPVADGSAEWALWQMKQGKKVCHKSYTMKTTHCAINDESQVVIFTTPYSVANGGDVVCHADEWLDRREYGCGVDERTGWQLYKEPKPETAKEPEIVAHKQRANCLVCGKVIEGLLDGHATVSIKRYSISSLYESTYSHYCGKCFLELGFDKTERELRNRQQPIVEPEPEPKFAVGDWVTDGVVDGYIAELDNGIAQVKKYGISYSANVEHLRKLSPSEVVLDFGSGIKGTIRRYRGEQIRIYDGDINFACLAISYVTEPMQATVRKLLAAIEEERKKQ
jgi:hypothetical protein